MNKLFLTNSALLLVFMGFQQWLICYSNMQLSQIFNVLGHQVSLTCVLWQLAVLLPAIFAGLSLLVPLIMLKGKHLHLSTKAEKVAAFAVTPLLFFGMTHTCACLPYNWSPANLVGPAQIHHFNFEPKI